MPLSLIVGPAGSGKISRLLDRYLASVDDDPFLVVPNRAEAERIERQLLAARPGLLGGRIGTFDDLFEEVGSRVDSARPVLTRAQRRLVLADVATRSASPELAASSRFAGFAEALGEALADAESALLEPTELGGPLGTLHEAYRSELDRLGCQDREQRQQHAVLALQRSFDAWDERPVLAYGFEDLSGAQWALLEGLAARVEVTVSLPYEPGRLAFEAVSTTANDLVRLAGGRVEELPRTGWGQAPDLELLERRLFETGAPRGQLGGGIRFLEAAGTRAMLELVAGEVRSLLVGGEQPERIGVVCPDVERVRRPLELVFGAFGIPISIESGERAVRTPLGRALVALLRFAWLDGGRGDLFRFLRSPFSGLARARVDFVEGRLRGRAISDPERVVNETVSLLGRPLRELERAREEGSAVAAARELLDVLLASAWPGTPPPEPRLEADLAAHGALRRTLDELDAWERRAGPVGRAALVTALELAELRVPGPRPGRVAVLDLRRVRTRRFEALVVLGLEEGVLPRRSADPPFLPDSRRRELDEADGRRRLTRPDPLARDRYLFYTACARARTRLLLAREASTDDGRPLEPSPFLDEVRSLFDETSLERATVRRPLSLLAWPVDRAPTERERLRAVAGAAATDRDEAWALARANGWQARIERALGAFERRTRLVHPLVRERLDATSTFSVTELERFGDCSSMWLVERQVDPKEIDGRVDARLRGSAAHTALHRFFAGLPKRFGADAVPPERIDEAIDFMRECVADAVRGQARLEISELELVELELGLRRDLEQVVRQEVRQASPLVPRRFEVAFGSERAATELQRGLDLGGFTVSGKIDRVDADPWSARGVVLDYKSGSAHSAARIETDGLLQVPLYVLAMRELLGLEPVGGLYRSLSGERLARGMLHDDAREELVAGYQKADYLEDGDFWAIVDGARERARASVARIRQGDVRHDPRAGECPTWCTLWSICRIERA